MKTNKNDNKRLKDNATDKDIRAYAHKHYDYKNAVIFIKMMTRKAE